MKKITNNFKNIMIFFLVIGFVSSFLISCQKDEDHTQTASQKNMFPGYSDSEIEDNLIAFLDNLETIRKNPKDPLADQEWELESIVWYLEACVNYKYGVSVKPELIKADTSCVNVVVSGDKCKLGNVQVVYDAMVDSIADYFYALREDKKYFLMANVSIINQTSQNVTLQVISYFTLNGIIPDVNDHDWYWGLNSGQCETNIGAPLDAADIIMRGANHSIYIPSVEFYYTDSQFGFHGHTFEVVNSENEPLGFYAICENRIPGPCISENDILKYTLDYIQIGEIYQVPNKEIVYYFLMESFPVGYSSSYPVNNCNLNSIFHYGYIYYGIRHYRTTSSDVLPDNSNNM